MIELFEHDKFTFFWDGPFSQWYTVDFVIERQKFSCAEQYMMYKKAMTFNDHMTAAAVLETPLPREQKVLGRQVRNFNAETWNAVARDIVFRGNIAKFSQNGDLRLTLNKTHGTLIVEASPYDKVWGIGLDAITAEKTPPSGWKGTNWLGQILTEVRVALF